MSRFSGVVKSARELTIVPEQNPEPEQGREVRPAARPHGKKSSPDWRQVTVYLRGDVHSAARKILFDERRQFSDLVNDLVRDWLTARSADVQKSGS